MTKIKPLRDNVLIEREKVSQIGKILTPEQADEYRFFIRAVGPDVTDVKVGDEVDINVHTEHRAISPAGLGEDWALTSVKTVVCKVERSALDIVSAR